MDQELIRGNGFARCLGDGRIGMTASPQSRPSKAWLSG